LDPPPTILFLSILSIPSKSRQKATGLPSGLMAKSRFAKESSPHKNTPVQPNTNSSTNGVPENPSLPETRPPARSENSNYLKRPSKVPGLSTFTETDSKIQWMIFI
jgi:hypothetical protein